MQPPSTSPAGRPRSPVPASWPMGGQRYPSARKSGQHDLTGHGSQAPRTTRSARITASAAKHHSAAQIGGSCPQCWQ